MTPAQYQSLLDQRDAAYRRNDTAEYERLEKIIVSIGYDHLYYPVKGA